jgi:hypothetical protein
MEVRRGASILYLYRGCMAWGDVYNEVFTATESTGDSHGGPFQQYVPNGVVSLRFPVRNRAFEIPPTLKLTSSRFPDVSQALTPRVS